MLFTLFILYDTWCQQGGSSNCPPNPSLYQVFTRFVCCFTRNQLSSALIRLLQKIMHFQSKRSFFFQLIAGQFWFCCFVYVFLRALFRSSSIMKLRLASHWHICIASYLASQQLMWHSKKIHVHSLKVPSCCCFFGFWGN